MMPSPRVLQFIVLLGAAVHLAPARVIAQASDFRPGYILKPGEDTLRGLVAYKSTAKLARSCTFRVSKESKPADYTPSDLQGFGFDNDRQFESIDLPKGMKTTGRVFALLLADGVMTLFNYDGILLIRKDSLQMLPPPTRTTIETPDGIKWRTDARFIGMLNLALLDCGLRAEDVAYSNEPMKKLITRYNECKGYSVPMSEPPVVRLNYYAFGGYMKSSLTYLYSNSYTFAPVTNFTAGAGLDISFPRSFSRLYISTEFWSGRGHYEGHDNATPGTTSTTLHLDMSWIKVPLGLRYDVLKHGNTPYIKGGLAIWFLRGQDVWTDVEEHLPDGSVTHTRIDDGYLIKTPKGYWISVGYSRALYKRCQAFVEFRFESNDGFLGLDPYPDTAAKDYNVMIGLRF